MKILFFILAGSVGALAKGCARNAKNVGAGTAKSINETPPCCFCCCCCCFCCCFCFCCHYLPTFLIASRDTPARLRRARSFFFSRFFCCSSVSFFGYRIIYLVPVRSNRFPHNSTRNRYKPIRLLLGLCNPRHCRYPTNRHKYNNLVFEFSLVISPIVVIV